MTDGRGRPGAADGGQGVPAVFAVAAPLWQAATPPETLTRLYAEEPGPAHLGIAFESTLIRLVSALKGGMAHRS